MDGALYKECVKFIAHVFSCLPTYWENILGDTIHLFCFVFLPFVASEIKLDLFGECRDVKGLLVFQQKVETRKSEIVSQSVKGQVVGISSLCRLMQMGAQQQVLCPFFWVSLISVSWLCPVLLAHLIWPHSP